MTKDDLVIGIAYELLQDYDPRGTGIVLAKGQHVTYTGRGAIQNVCTFSTTIGIIAIIHENNIDRYLTEIVPTLPTYPNPGAAYGGIWIAPLVHNGVVAPTSWGSGIVNSNWQDWTPTTPPKPPEPQKCECGSGNDKASDQHSTWCKQYRKEKL